MLSAIKSMIAEKSEFLEAADILFEEGAGINLDNTIVLGEEVEDDEADEQGTDDEGEEKEDDVDTGSDGEYIMDTPVDGNTNVEDNKGVNGDVDDMLNSPIDSPVEQPMPLPGNDIPTPVGRQTGEPIDGMEDILNMEIDLKTNTPKDTLPIPPAGAGDAVAGANDEMDDFLNQRIDAGYGGDTLSEESNYTEAITLDGGGDNSGDSSDNSGSTDNTSSDDGGSSTDGDNTVTAAVKDKVDEASTEDSFSDDLGGDSSSSGGVSQDVKDELMKKLSNMTTGIENAKKLLIDA